eukprot:gb/GECG01000267.1/.p1 GENE.gb/GECG01000267.1/~~gb/GECG01000267.1/.p1  ORF type:complete len:161 (+),score=6.47 gb/GECG01000267.1/:1-483(+)
MQKTRWEHCVNCPSSTMRYLTDVWQEGMTPLHVVAKSGNELLLDFLLQRQEFSKDLNCCNAVRKILGSNHCQITPIASSVRLQVGDTPVHFICKAENLHHIKLCHSLGGDIRKRNQVRFFVCFLKDFHLVKTDEDVQDGKSPKDMVKIYPFSENPAFDLP